MHWFQIFTWFWMATGVLTFIFLIFSKIRAPYGRHTSSKWGPTISNKWGWFIMEIPALLVCPVLAIAGPREKDILSWVLISLWVIHYINRVFIFPFRIKTSGKRMPVFILISAVLFNTMNGFINGYYLGYFGKPDENFYTPVVLAGFIIFISGMYINQKADSKLISLRKDNKGYQIPQGWLFEYISCPNHLGEIIEWTGFAIIAMNLSAISFAVWTFSNLAPRAYNHHSWYREKFPNYPENRKILIPYLW